MIKNGARLAPRLVIPAPRPSPRILDWNDRGTCVLFGDSARRDRAASGEQGAGTSADRGVLANTLHSDGRQHDILYVERRPVLGTARRDFLRMEAVGRSSSMRWSTWRRSWARLWARLALPRQTSTGWCRTRPTSASSTGPDASSAFHRSAWSSLSTSTPTHPRLPFPAGARSRRSVTWTDQESGDPGLAGRHRRRPCVGGLAGPLVIRNTAETKRSLQRNVNRRRFKCLSAIPLILTAF